MNEKVFDLLNELALQAGCSRMKDSYNQVRQSIRQSIMKQYAVLGDVNAGKSTVMNILAGEKKLPVSMRSDEHEKVALVESDKDRCRWVELNSQTYTDENLANVGSPMWYMDAAVYILSATTPFSQQDLAAIKACFGHGVPCTLVLSKLDMVDQEEQDEIIAYVKKQAERRFGTEEVIILNTKDAEGARRAVLDAFVTSEESRDVREYMLAVSYAKSLKQHISAQHEAAREKMQEASNRQKQAKQAALDDSIAWDTILLELQSRQLKLVDKMSGMMHRLYNESIEHLTAQASLAKSPRAWWENDLEKAFGRELTRISDSIDRMICTQVAQDRDWLLLEVERKFGVKPNVDTDRARIQLAKMRFGVAPDKLSVSRKTKTAALAGLVITSAALCGVLAYPVIAMHSINSIYWKLAGAAVVGTGFWTFMEIQKDRDAKRKILREEISRYVHNSRDENIEVLKKNIAYGYENMSLSVQDVQLASAKPSVSQEDTRLQGQFKAVSEMNRQCDEILNTLLSKEN